MKHILKQFNNSPYKKHVLPAAILCVLALAIWNAGPLLWIANSHPLAPPEKRFYVISLLFLAWIIKITFFDAPTSGTANQAASKSAELAKKIQLLEGRFQGAIRFLKKTSISKHGKDVSLYHLPWYLLIGPANAGKTTLLANANINYILAKQFKNEMLKAIPPSDVCDWWVTRELVLLDTPGSYTNNAQKGIINPALQHTSLQNMLWKNFLGLIKKYRGKQALTGVILALSLPELIDQQHQDKDRILAELKQRMIELREKFGNDLPFYLTITKCDLLPGFLEYFSDSGSDELAQAWGVTLPPLKENEQLLDVLTERFNALIKRLNKQLIWRLHQARNPLSRPFIKDFPLQIDRVKENILSVLKELSLSENHFNLQGVYLTSAIQHPPEEQHTTPSLATAMSTQVQQITCPPIMPSRAYFVRQLFLQGLLPPSGYHIQHAHNWRTCPATYALAASAFIVTAGVLTTSLHHIDLAKEQPAAHSNYLAKARALVDALPFKLHHDQASLEKKSAQNTADKPQQPLQTVSLTEMKNMLEIYLQKASTKSPENLYVALKAYLMLGDKQHLDSDFVIETLKQAVPALFKNQDPNQLANYIRNEIKTSWQPMTLDEEIITDARQQLASLPPVELSYAILKTMGTNNMDSPVNLGTNSDNAPAFILHATANHVPNMFTAEAFQTILNQQINTAATEVIQGNWILGSASTDANHSTLIEQLRTLYIANYTDAWENILSNIKLPTPTSLAQTDAIIKSITSNNSPLLQLLDTVRKNTALEPVTAISPTLTELNTLQSQFTAQDAATQTNSTLYKAFSSLHQLHLDLQTILHASNIGDAAFQATLSRMKNTSTAQADTFKQLYTAADQSPLPLKNWLNDLATQSWHYLLQESGQYIEKRWQTEVMSDYRSALANRFPFKTDATDEVPLEQFVKFLGANGTLTHFCQQFIYPFIDNTGNKWVWKKMNNEQIPFADGILNQLQNIVQLQHAFFPNENNQLFLKFALQPIALEKTTKSLHLNINGQPIEYDASLPQIAQILAWPGNQNTHNTSLQLQTADNQSVNSNMQGDWGWFRLVNNATIQTINQRKLLLNFDVDGHKAKYLLFTQSDLNPFLALNLQQLKLPEQLETKTA